MKMEDLKHEFEYVTLHIPANDIRFVVCDLYVNV